MNMGRCQFQLVDPDDVHFDAGAQQYLQGNLRLPIQGI